MWQIKRKDLSAKTILTTFELIIDDENMNKRIIKVIEQQGDRQNHSSNVKAQMTDWKMMDQPGFKELAEIIKEATIEASKQRYGIIINPVITDMWGIKYNSEEIASPHDHYPSTWSCAYYINPPKESPGLFFTEAETEIKLENGLLVLFEGNLKHEVRPAKFEGNRYVVSANLYHFCMILKKK